MKQTILNIDIDQEIAKAIVDEVIKPIRKEIRSAVKEYMDSSYEEYLDITDTAKMLGCSTALLYKNKDTLLNGVYTYFGKSLRFPKYKIIRMMRQGELRSPNI